MIRKEHDEDFLNRLAMEKQSRHAGRRPDGSSVSFSADTWDYESMVGAAATIAGPDGEPLIRHAVGRNLWRVVKPGIYEDRTDKIYVLDPLEVPRPGDDEGQITLHADEGGFYYEIHHREVIEPEVTEPLRIEDVLPEMIERLDEWLDKIKAAGEILASKGGRP